MPAAKKFTAARAAKRGVKAEFEIDWEGDDGTEHTETFYCWPGRATGATLFDLTVMGEGAQAMWDFFTDVMGDGYEDFRKFVKGPHGVEAEHLREIANWIIEYDTGDPTEQSSS